MTDEQTRPVRLSRRGFTAAAVTSLAVALAVVLLLLKQELNLTLLQLNLEEAVYTLKDLSLLEESTP